MISANFLIVVTWLQAGAPLVSITPMNSLRQCEIGRDAAVSMVQTQAASNLAGMHARLVREVSEGGNEVTLRTRPVEREIARLRCVTVGPSTIGPTSAATKAPGD